MAWRGFGGYETPIACWPYCSVSPVELTLLLRSCSVVFTLLEQSCFYSSSQFSAALDFNLFLQVKKIRCCLFAFQFRSCQFVCFSSRYSPLQMVGCTILCRSLLYLVFMLHSIPCLLSTTQFIVTSYVNWYPSLKCIIAPPGYFRSRNVI